LQRRFSAGTNRAAIKLVTLKQPVLFRKLLDRDTSDIHETRCATGLSILRRSVSCSIRSLFSTWCPGGGQGKSQRIGVLTGGGFMSANYFSTCGCFCGCDTELGPSATPYRDTSHVSLARTVSAKRSARSDLNGLWKASQSWRKDRCNPRT
jgi:hypothetical protein